MQAETLLTLSALVTRIEEKGRAQGAISIADIRRLTGRRMAGALLFFPAMIVVSPLSLVPTLPTMVAIIVLIVAGQLLIGKGKIWLPRRLLGLSLSGDRLEKAMKFLKPAASWIDKVARPRWGWLAQGIPARFAAAVCIFVALTMPPLEFFPGASTAAGVIIAVFGLALMTLDGLLMLAALGLVATAMTLFTLFIA